MRNLGVRRRLLLQVQLLLMELLRLLRLLLWLRSSKVDIIQKFEHFLLDLLVLQEAVEVARTAAWVHRSGLLSEVRLDTLIVLLLLLLLLLLLQQLLLLLLQLLLLLLVRLLLDLLPLRLLNDSCGVRVVIGMQRAGIHAKHHTRLDLDGCWVV